MPRLLAPTLDVAFKPMFARPAREALLAALLTAVRQLPSPIATAVVLHHDLDKETLRDRGGAGPAGEAAVG